MSKQVATLLVGLLAMAEGRATDRNMLNEANREDVLNEIDHEMLDKIAQRLYAEEPENLSAYERLVKDDKRKKMEYLNNIRPDLGEQAQPNAEDFAPIREQNSRDHVQADNYRGYYPNVKRPEQPNHAHLMELMEENKRVKDGVQRPVHHDPNSYYNLMPETTRTPKQYNQEQQKRYKEELIHKAQERQKQREDDERHEQEEREKRIQDRLDEERKAEEERVKRDEERRKKRRDAKKRRREDAKKREEERSRAIREAELQHNREHQDQSNSILDKYPSLNITRNLETTATQQQLSNSTEFKQDTDFVIEPRFKTEEDYEKEQEQDAEPTKHKEHHDKEAKKEETDRKQKKEYHKTESEVIRKAEASEHGDVERHSIEESSDSRSSSSSSSSTIKSSSSSSSTSSYFTDSEEQFHAMDEKEAAEYKKWVKEQHKTESRPRRAHVMEEEILRYEQEQKKRHQMSVGETSSSQPTLSEKSRSAKKLSRRERAEVISESSGQFELDHSSFRDTDSERLHRGRLDSTDEVEHVIQEKEALRHLHDKFDEEIAAAHSDEEHYYAHYSRLQEEMQQLADEAQRVKHEAEHEAKEADDRALSAEQRAREAEERAAQLHKQAQEAEQRVAELERQALEAEGRVHEVEHEWQTSKLEQHRHIQELREAQHKAEFEQEQIFAASHYQHEHLQPYYDDHHRDHYYQHEVVDEYGTQPFNEANEDQNDYVPWHMRPAIYYPPGYTPPKIDDDPEEITSKAQHYSHPTGPKTEKVERSRSPLQPSLDVEKQQSEPVKDKRTQQPSFKAPVMDGLHSAAGDNEEWKVNRNLRAISEHGEKLLQKAEEARARYKHQPEEDAAYLLNLNDSNDKQKNEAFGSAMLEDQEKEREIELSRVKKEQELREDYERKISELTQDYKAKLMDLDKNYNDKKFEIDKERQEIEMSTSMAVDSVTGEPYALDDPSIDIDPGHRHLHKVLQPDQPEQDGSVADRPVESGNQNDAENFEFQIDTPSRGFFLNLQQNPGTNEAAKDPLSDIKRRERDLQHERYAKEMELQREYEQRLADFEIDFQVKERELEKEKLYQERRIIAQREHELELENQEARKFRREQRKQRREAGYGDDYEANSDEEDDSDEDDSDEDDDSEEDDLDDYDLEDDENGKAFNPIEAEDDHELFNERLDSTGKDIYEIEWQLDLVPKRVVPKQGSRKPATAAPPSPQKKDRKDRRAKKPRRGGEPQRGADNEDPQRSSRRRHRQQAERNERSPAPSRHHKHRNHKNEYYDEEPLDEDRYRQHRHHRRPANELSFGSEYRHGEDNAPIVTENQGQDNGLNYGILQYEPYELPQIKQHFPNVRVPVPIRQERPPHPLGGHYSNEEQYDLEMKKYGFTKEMPSYDPRYPDFNDENMFSKQEKEQKPGKKQKKKQKKSKKKQAKADPQAHPIFGTAIVPTGPIQKKEIPPTIQGSTQQTLHKEAYGPQFPDRSTEFISQQHPLYFTEDHKPIYGTYDGQGFIRDNAMNTRTFPKMKMEKYDPVKMAKSLAEAKKKGVPEEKEIPLHRQEHRHQTHSFEIDTHPDPLEEPIEEVTAETKEELKPKEPKNIKHVADLPVKKPPSEKKKSEKKQEKAKKTQPKVTETKTLTPKMIQPESHHLEVSKDAIPPRDLMTPDSFSAHRDPLTMNFEKIAMHRAQKQHEFFLKNKDEEHQQDKDHKGKISTYAELLAKDQKMAAEGSELDRAFRASEEDYEIHRLMKPRFEDFKLRFVGPHDQVMDSATEITPTIEPTAVIKPEQKQEGAVDFSRIASERDISQALSKERHFAEDHPEKQQHHQQRRLEELGIGLDDFWPKDSKVPASTSAESIQKGKTQEEDSLPTLVRSPVPIHMPLTKSYIPTQPVTVMQSSYSIGDAARSEHDLPMQLDLSKGSSYGRSQAKVYEDLTQHKIEQDLKQLEHDVSLQAQRQQQQQYYYQPAPEVELPVFDPSTVMSRVQTPYQPVAAPQQEITVTPTVQFQSQQPQPQPLQVQQKLQQPFSLYPQQAQPQQIYPGQQTISQQEPIYATGSMYQAPQQWYEQTSVYHQQTPTTMYTPVTPMIAQPTITPITTTHLYPSTPYMPPELNIQPTNPSTTEKSITPMKSLPYQPKPTTAPKTPTMPSSTHYTSPYSMTSTPEITMTRDLTKESAAMNTPRNIVTPVKSLNPQPRNELGDWNDVYDPDDHYYTDSDDDESDYDQGSHHTYSGHDHPVVISSTDSKAFIDQDGDQVVVADGDDADLGEEIVHELGQLSSWFGSTFFLDNGNDTEAAQQSNKYLQ